MEIVLAKEDTAVTKSEPWDTQNNTMLSRWKQSTKTLLFRVAKTCVECLPGWLLRFRPFGVYEIRFGDGEADSSGSVNASEVDAAVSISWIADREQLTKLIDIAAEENLQAWDGTTRRVAIAWLEDRPVGAAWIARETFAEPDLGLSYRLQRDEAWLFAAVVQPEHRRQGIYGCLLQFLIDELADEKLSRLLLGISTGNAASLAAHTKFGAKQIGSIFAVKSLGFGYCRTSGEVQRQSLPMTWLQEFVVSCRANAAD